MGIFNAMKGKKNAKVHLIKIMKGPVKIFQDQGAAVSKVISCTQHIVTLFSHVFYVACISHICNMSHAAAAAVKSLQSCPTLCDPINGSPPGSPVPGFSRQEHWSGLPFPSPMHESEK